MLSVLAACVSYFPSIVSSPHLLTKKKTPQTNLTWKTWVWMCVHGYDYTREEQDGLLKDKEKGSYRLSFMEVILVLDVRKWVKEFKSERTGDFAIIKYCNKKNLSHQKRRRETRGAIKSQLVVTMMPNSTLQKQNWNCATKRNVGGPASLILHYWFLLSLFWKTNTHSAASDRSQSGSP